MIEQGFHIGNRDWWVMVYYDARTEGDLQKVEGALLASGCPRQKAMEAVENLRGMNCGYTFTNFDQRTSILVVGKTSSTEQMFDTIVHEMKHLAENVGEYYNINPKEELSAYLQGEVGRKMWPAAALVLCPQCHQ